MRCQNDRSAEIETRDTTNSQNVIKIVHVRRWDIIKNLAAEISYLTALSRNNEEIHMPA